MTIEHNAAASEYWRSYGDYAKRMAEGDLSALIDSPIVSQVVQTLLYHLPENSPSSVRLRKVAEFLVSEHFRVTPYNDLSARIYACLKAMVKEGAYRNAATAINRLSGFFFDVKHVATYAPYCDAFIVDKPMAVLLARPEVSISERYGVKIFSLSNWDKLFSWFETVKEEESAEHKQALADAYQL